MNSSVVKVWCSKCACFHCEDRPRPKDHMMASLNNSIRDALNERIPGLPECIRTFIHDASLEWRDKYWPRKEKNS